MSLPEMSEATVRFLEESLEYHATIEGDMPELRTPEGWLTIREICSTAPPPSMQSHGPTGLARSTPRPAQR